MTPEERRQEIEERVARTDMPDCGWEDRIDEEKPTCKRVCANCRQWHFFHVYSRRGKLWHFCPRCDSVDLPGITP